MSLPLVYLVRHGETNWSVAGQHTGLTDLPLTERGEQNSARLRERLAALKFERVFTSPLQRATRTCEIAGFKSVAVVDHDLVEWDYGSYEGMTSTEIDRKRPGWELFRDGCPEGETIAEVAARADRIIAKIRAVEGDVLLFSSGHILRVLASRWLGLNPSTGRFLLLGTASMSVLGFNHNFDEPAIHKWNG